MLLALLLLDTSSYCMLHVRPQCVMVVGYGIFYVCGHVMFVMTADVAKGYGVVCIIY